MRVASSIAAPSVPIGVKIIEQQHQSARHGRWVAVIVGMAILLSLVAVTRIVRAQEPSSRGPDTRSQSAESPGSGKLTRLDPDVEQHYLRALQFRTSGDEARAERELKEVVANAPKEDKYVRSLALFYIAKGRSDDAISVIKDYVNLCGVTALGYELEAELLFHQKLYDAALEAVLGSLKLSDDNARMHQLLGLIYVAHRQDGAAALELRKAAELDPNQAQTRYFLGRVLYSTGVYSDARDQFLACLRIQPGYRKALENLGLCYEALEDDPRAAEAYASAIELEKNQAGPQHAEPYAFYGAMLAKSGQIEKALVVLEEAVTVSPKSFVANYHLGRVLLTSGQLERAERFLRAAFELEPKFSRTYYLLGTLRQKQHQRADAARYWALFKELDQVAENRVFPLTDR
jgi:tetratricopeptide (TPR) repeat protein